MNQSEFLEAVFAHYNLVLPLGGEKSIHCPVHDDSHKSASVNSEKGVWVCHACNSGGSGIQIVMGKENMTYSDAREWAEKHIGKEKQMAVSTSRTTRRVGTRWTPPRLRRT